MSRELLPEEKYILKLLKCSIASDETTDSQAFIDIAIDVVKVMKIAQNHMVLSIMYEALSKVFLPPELMRTIESEAKSAVVKNYRLLFLSRAVQEHLNNHGIETAILKGVATASLYQVPEYRKSGDVDILLLDETRLKYACELLKDLGLKCNDTQRALHHVSFETEDGIDVELHTMMAEPFDSRILNDYLHAVKGECKTEKVDVIGVEICVLTKAYNAYELLLHMLQHFLRAGFGLKLLCDWVVFWNQDISGEEKKLYLKLVTESKIKGFSDMVTGACINYLGLNKNNVSFMDIEELDDADFIADVFDAEEFGHSSGNRMVGMRGGDFTDYIREFHHQTLLNYPKASKAVITLPVLWSVTLVKFLVNNKKIRNVSTREVLKTAKNRGKLVNSLHLFEK